jgi:hypothetical protein
MDNKWKFWSLTKGSRVPQAIPAKEFSGYPLKASEDSNDISVGAKILAESHKNNYSSGILKGILLVKFY